MFRPFPEAEMRGWLAGRSRVGVLDRDLCPGLGGILWSETRGCADRDAIVQGYVVGLGGGDILPDHVGKILADLLLRASSGEPPRRCTRTPILFAGGCAYPASTSPSSAS